MVDSVWQDDYALMHRMQEADDDPDPTIIIDENNQVVQIAVNGVSTLCVDTDPDLYRHKVKKPKRIM